MVWTLRVVLWAVILIVGYRGIAAIFFNQTPSSGNGNARGVAAAPAAAKFPEALGEAFAQRFGSVYLNVDPDKAAQRAQSLAAFIPASVRASDPEFGWTGTGTSATQSVQVAGIDVRSAKTAVVTLLATVNGNLMELGVPLYASGGALVVSAEPAWLPAPHTATLPQAHRPGSDQAAKSALASQLPEFFRAFASGDQAQLSRYLAPGASTQGPGRRSQLWFDHFAQRPTGRSDTRHHGNRRLDASRAGWDGGARTRDNVRHVGHRPAKRKMVCKGHPCIYAADGIVMTWFASPRAVPPGPRSPRKLTDVHGREG